MSSSPVDIDTHDRLKPGQLPDWGKADLPAPLPYSFRNVMRTIGPGAILLAASIGGGEWLAGPAATVKFGLGILWIATVSIFLQLLFNLEVIRYTLYTGEPIITGIMRLKPGTRFWGGLYTFLTIAQLGAPALASAAATVLMAGYLGAIPGVEQQLSKDIIAVLIILGTATLLMFGGTIERMLERISWAMIAYIFSFLFVVNIFMIPFENTKATFRGFFQFGYIPDTMDLMLLVTFAATAGSGGIGNLTISNWIRDKGFGMGGTVGGIPSAFGGEHAMTSHIGNVFPITEENLSRWKIWWKYVVVDQVWLWGLGCFVGMFLNVNLASAIMPEGSTMDGLGAGAYQAKFLAEKYWSGLWYLGLLNGFWILFSTHLGNTDVLVRTMTDTLWVASRRVRNWKTGRIQTIYYSLLGICTGRGLFVFRLGTAMDLFQVLGVIANFILTLAAIQVYRINTRLLPPELRPNWFRRGGLIACAAFYGLFCLAIVGNLTGVNDYVKHWLPSSTAQSLNTSPENDTTIDK
ncbi:MAG: Nramp family divalent metal transporter [Planctomycetota bacterium]|nr:Nramp family divalent metal transporter [Planctomycetota bacterium]